MASSATLDLIINLKDQASGPLGKLGGALGALGKVGGAALLGGAVAGVGALGAALVGGIGDARAAAIVFAQTEAVLASTGNASGKTATQISDLAASLSAASGASLFGDDLIQQSSNLLLTFTNIKGPIVDAATAISVDMAQALGGAPADAAVQLGKALNDPIAGISALSRVGVTFSEEQKGMIATMVETGNVAGAQELILAELNKEFGGSAAAAAAADGGMAMFKDRMGELAESVGAQVLPALNSLMAWLNNPAVMAGIEAFVGSLVTGFTNIVAFISGTVVPGLAPIVDWLSVQIPAAIAAATAAWAALQPALEGIGAVITTTIIPALSSMIGWFQQNSDIIGKVGMAVGVAVAVFQTLSTVVAVVGTVTTAIAGMGAGITAAGGIIATIIAVLGGPLTIALGLVALAAGALALAWSTNFGGIRDKTAAFTAWWSSTAVPAITTGVTTTVTQVGVMRTAWDRDWAAIQAKVSAVQSWWSGTAVPAITAGLVIAITEVARMRAAWDTAFAAVRTAITTMATAWNTAVAGIGVAVAVAIGYVVTFRDTVSTKLNEAVAFFTALPGRITSAVGDLSGLLVGAGKSVVQGLINGINSMIGAARSALNEVIGIINSIPGIPNLPSIPGGGSSSGSSGFGGNSTGATSQYNSTSTAQYNVTVDARGAGDTLSVQRAVTAGLRSTGLQSDMRIRTR